MEIPDAPYYIYFRASAHIYTCIFLYRNYKMGQAAKSRVSNGGSKGGSKGAQAQGQAQGSYWSVKNKQKKPKKVKIEEKETKVSSLRYVLLGLLVALISVGAGELESNTVLNI